MSKPFRDTSSGVGLDMVLSAPVSEEAAKERGETAAGLRGAERTALVEAPGSDGRIRAVLDAAPETGARAAEQVLRLLRFSEARPASGRGTPAWRKVDSPPAGRASARRGRGDGAGVAGSVGGGPMSVDPAFDMNRPGNPGDCLGQAVMAGYHRIQSSILRPSMRS